MSIRTIVTGGFGNGTFNGSIADVVRRGYVSGVAVAAAAAAAPDVVGGWRPIPLGAQPSTRELVLGPLFAETFGSVRFNRFHPVEVFAALTVGVAYPIRSTPLIAEVGVRSSIRQKESATYWLEQRLAKVEQDLISMGVEEVREAEEARLLGLL